MTSGVSKWIGAEIALAEKLVAKMRRQVKRSYVHDFRVTVKKLKAVVAGAADITDFETTFPNILLLYKKAGRVRDLQVVYSCLSSLPAWKTSKEAERQLARKIAKQKAAIRQLLARKELFDSILKELVEITALKTHVVHVEKMSEPQRDHQDEWHEIRKKTKTQIYQEDVKQPAHASSKAHKHLSKVQQLIGEWHDWQITVQWLMTNRKKVPAADYWPLKQQAENAMQKAANAYRQLH